MCENCIDKGHCYLLKEGDIHNCLKRSMVSANNSEWNKHLAEWNGWFQDL